jgi:hypothetical protein
MTEDLVVSVDSGGSWIALPLDDTTDVDSWAETTLHEAWAMTGGSPDDDALEQVVAVYAGLARRAAAGASSDLPLLGAYVLPRAGDLAPLLVTTLRAMPLPSDADNEAAVRSVLAEPDELYQPPDVEELETQAGRAFRVIQRVIEDDGTADPQVMEDVDYLWPRPADGVMVVLSFTTEDLVVGASHRSVCDALAASLRLDIVRE